MPGTVRNSPEMPGTVRNSPEMPGTVRNSPEMPGNARNSTEQYGTVRNNPGQYGTVAGPMVVLPANDVQGFACNCSFALAGASRRWPPLAAVALPVGNRSKCGAAGAASEDIEENSAPQALPLARTRDPPPLLCSALHCSALLCSA
eukprot:gene12476-biopygen18485